MSVKANLIFRNNSTSVSHIPQLGKSLKDGETVTMDLEEGIRLCKSSGNFTIDLDNLIRE